MLAGTAGGIRDDVRPGPALQFWISMTVCVMAADDDMGRQVPIIEARGAKHWDRDRQDRSLISDTPGRKCLRRVHPGPWRASKRFD